MDIDRIEGFDRDEGNIDKNWAKHRVSNSECEEVFFNIPLLIADNQKHSQEESRFYALGQTNADRFLFIAFNIRENKIRIISARDMSRKEKKTYVEANP